MCVCVNAELNVTFVLVGRDELKHCSCLFQVQPRAGLGSLGGMKINDDAFLCDSFKTTWQH